MAWPLSQDYNEAIQSPSSNFSDRDLRRGEAFANALGIPMPYSGNFADVYQVRCPGGARWAVKCFTREAPGLRERYLEISKHLQKAKLPFTVDFTYLEKGIRVAGQWYPVLKMQWVEGLTLNQFAGQYLDKPAMLEALLQLWARMAQYLRAAQIGHCDLQHGNVLLVPGSGPNSLALKLIDYDGMWVPALAGKKSGEVGHPSYQHPQRLREGTYSIDVDRFPLLLVATALRALKARKALWEKYDNGDNMLFREADLRSPGQAAVFQELAALPDPGLAVLAAHVRAALAGSLESAPLLEEAMPDARPAPARAPRPAPAAPPAAAVRKTVPAAAPMGAPAGDDALAFDDAAAPAASSFIRKRGKGKAKPGGAAARVPMAAWVGGGVALVLVAAVAVGLAVWALSPKPAEVAATTPSPPLALPSPPSLPPAPPLPPMPTPAELRLPVTDGLELWLDARALNDARKAKGEEELKDGDRVNVWYDLSGKRRNLAPKNADARPKFLAGPGGPAVLFDGQRASLSLAGINAAFRDATVVLVAAPGGNPGGFRGLLAMNQSRLNDFETGLNLDLGPAQSGRFEMLNVEGNGSSGARNLLQDPSDFGVVRRLAVISSDGPGGVRLFVDGKPNGQRERTPGSVIRMDEFALGGRCCGVNGGPAVVRNFLPCAVLDVLVYGRKLGSDDELKQLDDYLAERTADAPRIFFADQPIATQTPPPSEGFEEGESLTVRRTSSGVGLSRQAMTGFAPGKWSNDAQLHGKATQAGESVDLELPPVQADGQYRLIVCLTKAPDYGVVQFSLNNKPVGAPIDCFQPGQVIPTGPIDLGPVQLLRGVSLLHLQVTGTNDHSERDRYDFGLDWVALKPAAGNPAAPNVAFSLEPASGWKKVDPDGDCGFALEKGALIISVKAKDHDLDTQSRQMNAPRLLRDVTGDFTADVVVRGDFRASAPSTRMIEVPFTAAGLLLMDEDRTYARLERRDALIAGSRRAGMILWDTTRNGQPGAAGNMDWPAGGDGPTYLRLARRGADLHAWASSDGIQWKELPAHNANFGPRLKVGVIASTTSAAPFEPQFEDFRVTGGGVKAPAEGKTAKDRAPAEDDLRKEIDAVKEEHKDEYAKDVPKDRAALSAKLHTEADAAKDKSARRYALLAEARDLAAQAGDPAGAVRIAEEMADAFDVSRCKVKEEALEKAGKRTFDGRADAKPYLDAALPLLTEAQKADDYDTVAPLLDTVKQAASGAADPAVGTPAFARIKEFEKLRDAFNALRPVMQTLKDKPDDPEANLKLGKFYCFEKQDWDKALPRLANGGDAVLADAAAKDAANPASAADRLAAADAWSKAADANPAVQKVLQRRALLWYDKAVPDLADKDAERVKTRLADLCKTFQDFATAWGDYDTSKCDVVGNFCLRLAKGQTLTMKQLATGELTVQIVARCGSSAPRHFELGQTGSETICVWSAADKHAAVSYREKRGGRFGDFEFPNQIASDEWTRYDCALKGINTIYTVDGKPGLTTSVSFMNDASKARTFWIKALDEPVEVKSFTAKP